MSKINWISIGYQKPEGLWNEEKDRWHWQRCLVAMPMYFSPSDRIPFDFLVDEAFWDGGVEGFVVMNPFGEVRNITENVDYWAEWPSGPEIENGENHEH